MSGCHDPGCHALECSAEAHPPRCGACRAGDEHERTVWCNTCKGPHAIVEEGPEGDPDGWEWWVMRLDCGHEEAARAS